MESKEFLIENKYGLHARPASVLCDVASRYESDIKVFNSGKEANGKSVISILMLEVHPGLDIKVQVEGPDEKLAMEALTKLIDNNFNE
jgi:phosphocarrier protein HPr